MSVGNQKYRPAALCYWWTENWQSDHPHLNESRTDIRMADRPERTLCRGRLAIHHQGCSDQAPAVLPNNSNLTDFQFIRDRASSSGKWIAIVHRA